jgi:positive regulator of sigma E activity
MQSGTASLIYFIPLVTLLTVTIAAVKLLHLVQLNDTVRHREAKAHA